MDEDGPDHEVVAGSMILPSVVVVVAEVNETLLDKYVRTYILI